MPTITRFEEIEAWQTARELTRLIYKYTEDGKFARDFGLKDQIRRASVSIMSNIAEGFESQTQAQFIRYLGIAKASAGEVRSQLYVSRDLQYVTEEQFTVIFRMAEKNSRQIANFIVYLESHPQSKKLREDSADYET